MSKVNLFSLLWQQSESEWNEPDRNKWKRNATLALKSRETMIKNPSIDIIYSLLLWSILDYKFVWARALSSSVNARSCQVVVCIFYTFSICCLWIWFGDFRCMVGKKWGENPFDDKDDKFSDFWFPFVSQSTLKDFSFPSWTQFTETVICNSKYHNTAGCEGGANWRGWVNSVKLNGAKEH